MNDFENVLVFLGIRGRHHGTFTMFLLDFYIKLVKSRSSTLYLSLTILESSSNYNNKQNFNKSGGGVVLVECARALCLGSFGNKGVRICMYCIYVNKTLQKFIPLPQNSDTNHRHPLANLSKAAIGQDRISRCFFFNVKKIPARSPCFIKCGH